MKIKTEFLLPAMLLFSHNSQAFDWLFQPDFDTSERYTDNLRMQINPTRDNFITTLSPSLLVGLIDKNQELKTSFKWNELIYHGDPNMDDFGEKIADFSHEFTAERFKTSLAAKYAEESSLNTQLEQDGSGNLQLQVPRFTISVSPQFTYNFTEKYALQLSYNYLDVSFDKDPEAFLNSFNYSDYQNHQVSATAIHAYSDRLSFNLTGAYSRFTSPTDLSQNISGNFLGTPVDLSIESNYKQTSTNLTYQAGAEYIFDEKTQLSASAGLRDTETTTEIRQTTTYNPEIPPFLENFSVNSTPKPDKGIGYVYSANLARNEEWGKLILSADQQVTPSSNGNQRQTSSYSAKLNYDLTERWTTGIDTRYLLSDNASTNNDTRNNRTYFTVTPNIRWNWTPEINLNLSYSYRHQQYDNRDEPSISNNVQLQFSYQPKINRQVK